MLCVGGVDGNVKIWDLRKLAQSHEIDIGSAVNSLSFDYCGTFLSLLNNSLYVFVCICMHI